MRWWLPCTFVVLGFVGTGPAFGQLGALIYSQAPNRAFGFASDTAFVNESGQIEGSVYADRFSVATPSSIGQLVWYGIYGPQFGPIQVPPASESFRVRFYDQDGSFPPTLPPAGLLYEFNVSNPARTETGFGVGAGFPEIRFVVTLPAPFLVQSNTPYWLEVAQVGEPESYFRWESSTGGERAFQYPIGSAWQLAGGGQLAYELRVPEPGSGVLVGLVGLMLRRRGKWA